MIGSNVNRNQQFSTYTNLSQQNEIAQNNRQKMHSRDENDRKSNQLNDSQTSINSSTNSSITNRFQNTSTLSSQMRSGKISDLGQQLFKNTSIATDEHKQQQSYQTSGTEEDDFDDGDNKKKKLSFKAKLSAFESLTKVEPKKPIEKTPPVKNKLRMSSSSNLIADKKQDDKTDEQTSNFSKRYTSKSNENLNKFIRSTQQTDQMQSSKQEMELNARFNRTDSNTTKSESNLNINDISNQTYQPINALQNTQSDQQLNKETTDHQTEIMTNQQQFDCDYEISQLSKRMQNQQLSTLPNQQQQLTTTVATSTKQNPVSSINKPIHQSSQSIHLNQQPQQFINNSAIPTAPVTTGSTTDHQTTNYFSDDYVNSSIYNQNHHQLTSHYLISKLQPPQHSNNNSLIKTDYLDSNQSNYQQISSSTTKSQQPHSLSASSIIPQSSTGVYYDDNMGIYGNHYYSNQPTAYPLHNVG